MLRRSVFLLVLLVFSLSCAPADRAVTPKKNGAGAEGDLLKRAAIIHSEVLTLDAHADVEIAGAPSAYVGADGLSKVAPAKMRAGGLDAVVMALAVGPKPRSIQGYAQAAEIARKKLAAVRLLAAEPANNLVIVTRADELIDAHSRGQLAVLLGFQNALILGTQVEDLTRWFDAGVRVFALTHMGHNDFADHLARYSTVSPVSENWSRSTAVYLIWVVKRWRRSICLVVFLIFRSCLNRRHCKLLKCLRRRSSPVIQTSGR